MNETHPPQGKLDPEVPGHQEPSAACYPVQARPHDRDRRRGGGKHRRRDLGGLAAKHHSPDGHTGGDHPTKCPRRR